MQRNVNNSWICLLGGPEDDLIRPKHVALTKYSIFVYKGDRSKGWICLLGGPEDELIGSKHVAQTKYSIVVYK